MKPPPKVTKTYRARQWLCNKIKRLNSALPGRFVSNFIYERKIKLKNYYFLKVLNFFKLATTGWGRV
jgi:hypothetical protein